MGADRAKLAYACANLVGRLVEVQTTSGVVYEGICHAVDIAPGKEALGVALKKAYKKRTVLPAKPFGSAQEPPSRGRILHELMIKGSDVAQISAVGVDLGFKPPPPQGADGFTDTGISGGHGYAKERELEAWIGDDPSMDVDLSDGSRGRGGQYWSPEEMFKKNEQDHGIQTTWDENEYTTPLNTSDPAFMKKQAHASRMAREIMSGVGMRSNNNVHVQLDRGATVGGNVTEDQLFSAVQPVGKPGKSSYQPPFRRGPGDQRPAKQPSGGSRAGSPVKSDQGGGGGGGGGKKPTTPRAPPPGIERSLGAEAAADLKDLKAFSTKFKLADPKAEKPADAKGGGGGGGGAKKETKLNPNAASFSFNPGASTFAPKTAFKPAAAAAAPSPMAVAPSQAQMAGLNPQQVAVMQQQALYQQQARAMYAMQMQAAGGQYAAGYAQQQQAGRPVYAQQAGIMMQMVGVGPTGQPIMSYVRAPAAASAGYMMQQPGQVAGQVPAQAQQQQAQQQQAQQQQAQQQQAQQQQQQAQAHP